MPSRARVHVDRALTGIAISTIPVQQYVGLQVLKPIVVPNATDSYWTYAAGWNGWSKAGQTGEVLYARAPGAKYDRIEWDASTSTFACVEYGLEQAVDDSEQANADSPLDPLGDAAGILTMNLLSAEERRIAALLFDTSSTFSSYTAAPANKWDLDIADPRVDCATARQAHMAAGTWDPVGCDHVLLMGVQVWEDVRRNPYVIDSIKYTQGGVGSVTEEAFGRWLGVDKVLVGRATYNSAKEGATVVPAYVWGKYAGFYMVPKGKPSKGRPTLGFCPIWTRGNGGNAANGIAVTRYRDDSIRSWVVQVNHHTDELVTQAAAGYVFSSVVS